MKIGGVYGRSSDEETATREFGSLEQQEHLGFQQACYLSEMSGEEHVIKYVLIEDKAITGGHTNRPKYQQLLDLIRSRRIDFIVSPKKSPGLVQADGREIWRGGHFSCGLAIFLTF